MPLDVLYETIPESVDSHGIPRKQFIGGTFDVSSDGMSCVVIAQFDNGSSSESVLPFAVFMDHLHKMRAAAGKMVNQQRLFDVNNGVKAVQSLAAKPLRAIGFSVSLDRLALEFIVTLQFSDMAPIAVGMKPTLVRDLNAETLLRLLSAMN